MFIAGAILHGVVSRPRLSLRAPLLHGGHPVETGMYKSHPTPAEDGSAAPGILASVRLSVFPDMLLEFLIPTHVTERPPPLCVKQPQEIQPGTSVGSIEVRARSRVDIDPICGVAQLKVSLP